MAIVSVRKCTINEIQNAPNIKALLDEYVIEAHNPELPNPNVQWNEYKALESAGVMHPIGAFIGDELAGFVTVLVTKRPHHGATLAVTESVFVALAHRKRGAGLKLIRAAEQLAAEVGATCLVVSAPHNGSLERVMPRLGYRHSNTYFIRGLQ